MYNKRIKQTFLASLTVICHAQSFIVNGRSINLRHTVVEVSSSVDPLDDLPFDDATLEDIVFDMDDMIEDPEIVFSEEDLSNLYDISIPGINSTDSTPIPISLSDFQFISSDVAYFYLRDELGLSEDTMWRITNEAGSVLGMKASTLREKVAVLKTSMILSDEELRAMITVFPTLLHLSAENNLAPKIRFLLQELDLKQEELKKIVTGCPPILGYSFENLSSKLSFFTDTMGFTKKECRDILLELPRVIASSVETGLIPRLQFLRQEIRIPNSDIRKIVKKNPRVLTMSVEHNLQPKLIFYFIMTLYMQPDEVRKLLLSYPQILNYNLENHIQPITRQFLSFDFSAYEFSRMLLRFPRLMTCSLTKIKRVVSYLRFALGLEASDVRRVLHQAPQVVSLTIENLQQKVDYLLEVAEPGSVAGHPSSTRVLRKLIVGMPSLLHLNIETNLKPKVEFLQTQLGPEELSKAIDRLPTLLGYSLDNRIKPRLMQILEAGVDGGSITVGIPMKEDKFEGWLDRRAKKMAKENETKENGISPSDTIPKLLDTDEKGRIKENDGRVVHWVRKDR
ncbi:unnamed protein product [Cylindrotheca closterium]|uniref:Uncharacterized protein n=1 Tax=Cylindrotheca closterium TaxID=2856 RepID=A0AAD2FDT3_9STRA|nr:unnamed protein product [Cylindrotheca closterium]